MWEEVLRTRTLALKFVVTVFAAVTKNATPRFSSLDAVRTAHFKCTPAAVRFSPSSGFNCTVINGAEVCAPICGDGRRVGTEGCDDGNVRSGDGCTSQCVIEVCASSTCQSH